MNLWFCYLLVILSSIITLNGVYADKYLCLDMSMCKEINERKSGKMFVLCKENELNQFNAIFNEINENPVGYQLIKDIFAVDDRVVITSYDFLNSVKKDDIIKINDTEVTVNDEMIEDISNICKNAPLFVDKDSNCLNVNLVVYKNTSNDDGFNGMNYKNVNDILTFATCKDYVKTVICSFTPDCTLFHELNHYRQYKKNNKIKNKNIKSRISYDEFHDMSVCYTFCPMFSCDEEFQLTGYTVTTSGEQLFDDVNENAYRFCRKKPIRCFYRNINDSSVRFDAIKLMAERGRWKKWRYKIQTF